MRGINEVLKNTFFAWCVPVGTDAIARDLGGGGGMLLYVEEAGHLMLSQNELICFGGIESH